MLGSIGSQLFYDQTYQSRADSVEKAIPKRAQLKSSDPMQRQRWIQAADHACSLARRTVDNAGDPWEHSLRRLASQVLGVLPLYFSGWLSPAQLIVPALNLSLDRGKLAYIEAELGILDAMERRPELIKDESLSASLEDEKVLLKRTRSYTVTQANIRTAGIALSALSCVAYLGFCTWKQREFDKEFAGQVTSAIGALTNVVSTLAYMWIGSPLQEENAVAARRIMDDLAVQTYAMEDAGSPRFEREAD
ncbi:MAG: hypothetical protein KDK78_03250 [Chlamydiia bacterium]|nr:hypothetical protein [Chlamydiia bacterium]